MKLDMWEIMCIVILWWVCSTCYNFLNWQWQIDYDKAMHELFAVAPVDTQ